MKELFIHAASTRCITRASRAYSGDWMAHTRLCMFVCCGRKGKVKTVRSTLVRAGLLACQKLLQELPCKKLPS